MQVFIFLNHKKRRNEIKEKKFQINKKKKKKTISNSSLNTVFWDIYNLIFNFKIIWKKKLIKNVINF